jgi:AcrR family transcriptional regulator
MVKSLNTSPKEPEIRKREIVEAALELFLTQGFEETSVSDIVKKVGVAQGLFYYYFKSKIELLDAVVDQLVEVYLDDLVKIGDDDQLTAAQKFQAIMAKAFQIYFENERIVNFLHEERNERLHHRMEHKYYDKYLPVFWKVLEQGAKEKSFDLEFPRETLEIVLPGLEKYWHEVNPSSDPEQFRERIRISLTILEKALGAPKGLLQIFSE